MERKKIVIGVTAAETFLILGEFPDRLRDSGWDVTLISAPGKPLDDLAARGFSTSPLKMVRNPSPIADAKSLLGSIRILRDNRDALLLVGTPKASLILLLGARLLRIRTRIYDVKGLRYESESGLRRSLFRGFELLSMALATHVLAISPSIKNKILEDRLSRSSKVVLLGLGADHGVDTQHYRRALTQSDSSSLREELNIPDQHTVVGYVGRINRDKGLSELVECARTLAESRAHITFVVVGSNDAENFQPFLNSPPNVIRVEWVDDPRPYFGLFDIFCLPTYREGLPNVNLQASAMQVPVVTTNATGSIDTVVDGKTGLIVPVGSSSELEKAFLRLHSNTRLAQELGENGREWVRTNYEADLVQNRRVLWLESLLRGYDFKSPAVAKG